MKVVIKKVIIGAVINVAFLFGDIFVGHPYFAKWPAVFGAFWFFILKISLVPLFFLMIRQKKMFAGALIGDLLYLIAILIFAGICAGY